MKREVLLLTLSMIFVFWKYFGVDNFVFRICFSVEQRELIVKYTEENLFY